MKWEGPRSSSLVILGLFAGLPAATAKAGEVQMAEESKRIVSQYKAVFATPPPSNPNKVGSKAMLLGNGNIGVSIGGRAQLQRIWFNKNDFWRLKSHARQGYFTGIGHMDIAIPELEGVSYRAEQDLYTAKTTCRFTQTGRGNGSVTMVSYVAAQHPICVIELTATGKAFSGTLKTSVIEGGGSVSESGRQGDMAWFTRAFNENVDTPTGVAVAIRHYGGDASTLKLEPGNTVRIAVALKSLFETTDHLKAAKEVLDDSLDFEKIEAAHQAWWADYWNRCLVEIEDPVLEQRYYLSNYVMGSCCRDPEFPPSLFGPWIGVNFPGWAGDYHLNYNYQAPFYGLYSSNRIEQAMTYHAPLLAAIPRGQHYAKKYLNCRGVYFGVGVGPKGMETTRYWKYGRNEGDGLWMGQKSNAAYCVVNMAFHWYSTYDKEYGKTVYPFVREVCDFWEDYLKWEEAGKRYVIENDACHELTFGDMNPLLSLGLVLNSLELALDMSKELQLDEDRRDKWRHILDHLSEFPTQEREGKTVFRYSEKGTAWWKNNGLGIQHIYPGNAIGLDSDPKWLGIARNTIEVQQRWIDGNCMSSFFPAAVRVGYDEETILKELTNTIKKVGQTNGFIIRNPHGVENCSIVPNTVNMMLCMGHQHVLRVFPVWPKHRDARFTNIRAWGAFLVSSELKGGRARYVRILSERGRPCTMVNPWPGEKVNLLRGDGDSSVLSGERFSFSTGMNEVLELLPE